MATSKVICIDSKTQPTPQAKNNDDLVVIPLRADLALLVMPTGMILCGSESVHTMTASINMNDARRLQLSMASRN
jgi:hypothetical protein